MVYLLVIAWPAVVSQVEPHTQRRRNEAALLIVYNAEWREKNTFLSGKAVKILVNTIRVVGCDRHGSADLMSFTKILWKR